MQNNIDKFELNNRINVFQYWGQGVLNMPSFIKIIYNHNLDFCKNNNINLILIDDNNIDNYIKPHPRYKKLAYNFKSDIVRYYALHKYGGFWFDTDVIIIKDLNKLYNSLEKYEGSLDVEYKKHNECSGKIGCCSLYIKKESIVSNFCVTYINNILDNKSYLSWGDIGPLTAEALYKNHNNIILLNNYEIVKDGCNFISWVDTPGINKEKWYLKKEEDAKNKATKLKNNNNCYYLITWTIYRINDMKKNLNYVVFNDRRSVFSYFFNFKQKQIIIKNDMNDEWNGKYIEGNVQYKDNYSISYLKDDDHHVYLYKGMWKLGKSGVKVYKQLGNEIGNEIDLTR